MMFLKKSFVFLYILFNFGKFEFNIILTLNNKFTSSEIFFLLFKTKGYSLFCE